ncbi:MAG: DUF2384 domain-containing protein [Bdellovibrionales bacterium]|nr:DUF2384 domain-containing protein [Bdellovibrionales bacterium]
MDRSVPEWVRHIQIEWELSPGQIAALIRVDPARLPELLETKSTATLPPGLESAAPLIAIYRKLAARYPKTEDQVKWLFTEHRDFGGSKPIDVAASSLENLYWVGYYLDSSPA